MKLLILLKKIFWWIRLLTTLLKWSFAYIGIKHHAALADFFFVLLIGFSYKFEDLTDTIMQYEVSLIALSIFPFYLIIAKYFIHPIFAPNFIYHFYLFNFFFWYIYVLFILFRTVLDVYFIIFLYNNFYNNSPFWPLFWFKYYY